jgi:hypothetical protein
MAPLRATRLERSWPLVATALEKAGLRGYQKPRAALAQLVEHRIRNAEVVSSSLTSGTTSP